MENIHHGGDQKAGPTQVSFTLERLKFAFLANAGDREGAVVRLLDVTGIEELLHEISGYQTFFSVRLHHLDLYLQGIILGQLGLGLLLLQDYCLLIVIDLLLGPSAFAARLEEMGRDAFVRCRIINNG